MAKTWSKKEITYLERHAASKGLSELAERVDAEPRDVEAKLRELGLQAKGGGTASRLGNEPLLETYQKGLEALYAGKHQQAAKLLGEVAETCDQPELAERARQMARASAARAAAGDGEGGEDDYLVAVFEKNRGNYDRALEIAKAGGRAGKDERYAYLVAAVHAARERLDDAADALAKAIEMNSENRVHAYHDPDFAALRASEDHGELFEV